MPKSPKEMEEAIIRSLREKTSKSLEHWIELVKHEGPKDKKERLQWLKKVYGLGHFQANTIVKRPKVW